MNAPRIFATATVDQPGLYRMTEADYHADPCPLPSLSRSIAQVLIEQSPRHAWTAHPRLNPQWAPDEKNARKADIGSAAHAKLLGQPVEIVTIDAPTYQSNAAKAARDQAYDRGAIPLLTADKKILDGMMSRAFAELELHQNPVIRELAWPGEKDGSTSFYNEIVACWQDRVNGRWCRSRMDRLAIDDHRITIIDYKTTEMSAAPNDVKRAIFNNVYHLQDGFYRRGIRHLFPEIDRHEIALDFLFIVQEQHPPHEISVARITAPGRVIGEKMASAGVRLWDHALSTSQWPGYPAITVDAEMPAFIETNWTAREIEDERIGSLPFDPFPAFEATPYQPKQVTWGAG